MATPRVTAETTIARALAADPELVDRLVAFNPVFRKLKNPILRRTMAHLATFADAARVAGVALPSLLEIANGAHAAALSRASGAGADVSGAPAPETPAWVQTRDRAAAVEFDVRAILAAGEDPFARIMAVVAKLAPGAALGYFLQIQNLILEQDGQVLTSRKIQKT